MDKEKYLQKLETCLKKYLLKAEVADILSDYGEFFEEGRKQNKTDIEISAKLGNPENIAKQFIEESSTNKTARFTEEIGDITEKTAKGISTATSDLLNKIKSFTLFSSAFRFTKWGMGIIFTASGKFIKWSIKATVVAAKYAAIAFIFSFCFLIFCMVSFLLISTALALLFVGILGLIVSAASTSFISSFVTIGGFMASIFSLSLAGLCTLLIFNIFDQATKAIKWIIKTAMPKTRALLEVSSYV